MVKFDSVHTCFTVLEDSKLVIVNVYVAQTTSIVYANKKATPYQNCAVLKFK